MADWTAVERCRKPTGMGKRHILVCLGFCGFALSYAMRFSLSIAIVSMVNHTALSPHLNRQPALNGAQRNKVFFKTDICPHDKTPHEMIDLKLKLLHVNYVLVNKTGDALESLNNATSYSLATSQNDTLVQPAVTKVETPLENEHQGEFIWNEADQGVILGSFFWGYLMTQILGGWLSQRIGGKWPFGIGLAITGVFAIATPFAARFGGMPWVIVVRVIQGLAGGVTVPSMQLIIAQWFPPTERGKLGSLMFAGMPFGSSMSMLCSGYLIHYFGWPSVFYGTGLATIVWFFLWSYFTHACPSDDQTIDPAELKYIMSSLTGLTKAGEGGSDCPQTKPKLQVPWSKVLLSLPFWAILICNTSETWGLYTILTELPTYMKTVLHFDIKQNSIVTAFPHMLTLLVSLVISNLGDNLIERQYLSIGTVRKLSTSIALWGSAASLIGVAYSGCDRVNTVALLSIAIACNGGKFAGFLVNIIDIAPNYAGILMGVINTVASLPGFLAPWVAGLIINNDPSPENWRVVFLITAAVAFCGNLVYILYASGVEQSWNRGVESNSSSMDCINNVVISHNAKMKKELENRVYIIPPNNEENLPPQIPLPIVVNLRENMDDTSGHRCT